MQTVIFCQEYKTCGKNKHALEELALVKYKLSVLEREVELQSSLESAWGYGLDLLGTRVKLLRDEQETDVDFRERIRAKQ